jgi:cytochrome c oxidase subunit 2
MHVDPYERNWMRIAVGVLVVFAILITVAGFMLGIQVPTNEARVDPATFENELPWSEPGLRTLVEGEEYEAYIIARQFSYDTGGEPIVVPKGARVTFYVTSADVQHGFSLEGTNVNMMIIPGQVSKLSATFDEAGEYNFICHEYCGVGHAFMYGTLTVEG